MNQSELLQVGRELLKKENVEEYEIKAKRLLEYVLNQTREECIRNSLCEVSEKQEKEYRKKLEELRDGKPLQYITHNQKFMGLTFYVDENVLIPQPDTEILVEEAIKILQKIREGNENIVNYDNIEKEKIKILDLCTGSGIIAISLAKQIKLNNKLMTKLQEKFQIIATDISKKALEVAKKNAIDNKVQNEINFIQSDLFENVKENEFDIMVSNPPYIESSRISSLSKEVRQEPELALNGGKDGLKFYRVILEKASKYLKNDGYLLLEIGYDQGKKITNLWKDLKEKKDYNLELITKQPIKDLGENDRVMIFRKFKF